jgi:hypothetical protein
MCVVNLWNVVAVVVVVGKRFSGNKRVMKKEILHFGFSLV